MHKRFFPASAALLVFSCFLRVPAAHADTYTYNITTPAGEAYGLSGTLTLYTTAGPAGAQYVTSISGTVDNSANTGDAGNFDATLIPTTAPGMLSTVSYPAQNGSVFFFGYDNTLFPNGPTPLDGNGLAFMADNVAYDIGYNGTQALYLGIRPNDISFDQRTFQGVPINFTLASAAATPEPSSFALLGTGLMGAAGLLRRRRSA